MSAVSTHNPEPPAESKSSKKKRGKIDNAVPAPIVTEPEAPHESTAVEPTLNGAEGNYESPYIKELYKNIRNIKKKLNATQKVDNIISENPGVSLDDLLTSKKINADQKTQAQKKPALQASLYQLEEQISQYKQFDEDYQKRLTAEKKALETKHQEELEHAKEAASAAATIDAKTKRKDDLLVLSKFLRAAAAKRQNGDESSPENRAFEGALLLVYGGEAGAVTAMESLISGLDDKVPTVDSVLSDFTYGQVRTLAVEYAPYALEEAWAEEVAQSDPTAPQTVAEGIAPGTDPTLAHAGLTELEQTPLATMNGTYSHTGNADVPNASSIDAGAANKAGAANFTSQAIASGGDEWVKVPRPSEETDTGVEGTIAAETGTQSWADEIPVGSNLNPQAESVTNGRGGDGFREVQHHHRGGRGRGGEHRGGERRGRGGFRGDREAGHRGRGGFRGDRGGSEGGHRGRGRGGGGYRGRGGRGGPGGPEV